MTIDAERQRLRKPYALTIIGTFEGKKSGLLKGGLPMILAIVNQKGGVAKTTSAIALALHIARMGHNLLVIDADPQADTTFGFNIGEDAIKTSLADVLSRSRTPVESVVMPDVFPGVDLIPSHIELSRSELQLASEIAGENMLSRALAPIKDRYDAMGVHV